MSYNLEKENFEFKLTLNNAEVLDLEEKTLDISFIQNSKKHTVTFSKLKDFYKALENIKSLNTTTVTLKDGNSKSKVIFKNITENLKLTSNYYKFEYSKDIYVEVLGFANYNYTNYFMPKWSTAYKFQYSNHCKMVEPLFTDLNINGALVSKIVSLEDDPKFEDISKLDFVLKSETEVKDKPISNLQMQGFTSKEYLVNSKEIVNFSKGFNSIYIERLQDVETTIKIKGIQDNSFVEEQINLNDNSILKLKHNYQTIYDIEIVDFTILSDTLDFNSFTYKLSNCINIKENNLSFLKRKDDSYFEIEGEYLVYKRKDVRDFTVFNLGFNAQSCNIYIDTLDKIYVLKDNNIYTGRVEAKLDLQIDRDITYNNTKYIETTYLTSSEYLVEILLLDYIKDTEKNRVSITVKSPSATYYLNSLSELQTSSEELFINLSDLKRDKISFELSTDHDIETLTISINDIDGHYKKSSIIVHPKIILKNKITISDRDLVLLIADNLLLLDNLNLNLRAT